MLAEAVPAARPATLLAVDDDPAILGMLRTGLGMLGYDVDTAPGVTEARALLSTRAYSLVLCDYQMPGGNGLELLHFVSKVCPELPFIMLTGHDEAPLARAAIAEGALDFVSKPFELRQLARLIEQNLARLERDRRRAAELTNEVLTGTIRALVKAVDAKDPYTASHSERVTRLALRLGTALRLPPDRLRVLEFSALMHDVGKIAVPKAILRKPGPLDASEWEQVRQHPIYSAEIVGEVEALAEVASIVRHHHERLDGSGYPDGLAGEAIPELVRIIAIADAYEALTSDRSYRGALTHEAAMALIDSEAGTHFDPAMTAVFSSLQGLE